MIGKLALASLSLLAAASAQQVGTLTPETHPAMAMQTCTSGGTCTTKNTKIVLDSIWRWLHTTSGMTTSIAILVRSFLLILLKVTQTVTPATRGIQLSALTV